MLIFFLHKATLLSGSFGFIYTQISLDKKKSPLPSYGLDNRTCISKTIIALKIINEIFTGKKVFTLQTLKSID